MKPLSEVIKESLEFIEYQMGEKWDKYEIEDLFKRHSSTDKTMKNILEKWAIDESKVLLVEGDLHDNITKAEEFETLENIESHLKKREIRFRHATSFFLPIERGTLREFRMKNETKEIIGHELQSPFETVEMNLEIEWKS